MTHKNIELKRFDGGDNSAGAITVTHQSNGEKDINCCRVDLNKNHSVAVQFSTLAHELGHLYLGHIGPDKNLCISVRHSLIYEHREIEAESVSYLVCERNGVTPKSETYLARFVKNKITIDDINLYQVMRAAGQVETLLDLTSSIKHGNVK
jgi:antirestriction protein ArdC